MNASLGIEPGELAPEFSLKNANFLINKPTVSL